MIKYFVGGFKLFWEHKKVEYFVPLQKMKEKRKKKDKKNIKKKELVVVIVIKNKIIAFIKTIRIKRKNKKMIELKM